MLSTFVGTENTLRGVLATIHRAKDDPRVKTLVIVPNVGGTLWAQLQEVRDAITDFRTSGKPVTAYLESGGAQESFLASAADRVLMMPAGTLDLTGLATYQVFFRGTLDKIGVVPDMLHIGDYKTASNTFTEKGFTSADREMSAWLNKDWYDQLVKAIATGRKRSEDDIRRAIDGGPYLADGAQRAGLVDGLAYDDQIDDAAPVKGTRRLDADTYGRTPYARAGRLRTRDRAPVRDGHDCQRVQLVRRRRARAGVGHLRRVDPQGARRSGRASHRRAHRQSGRIGDCVRRHLARADARARRQTRHRVDGRRRSLRRLLHRRAGQRDRRRTGDPDRLDWRLDRQVRHPGRARQARHRQRWSEWRYAEIDSPFTPFSNEERAKLEAQLQATYDLFVADVAEGRHHTAAEMDAIGRGRVWTGTQGKASGSWTSWAASIGRFNWRSRKPTSTPRALSASSSIRPRPSLFDVLANPLGSSASAAASLRLLQRWPTTRADWRAHRRQLGRIDDQRNALPGVDLRAAWRPAANAVRRSNTYQRKPFGASEVFDEQADFQHRQQGKMVGRRRGVRSTDGEMKPAFAGGSRGKHSAMAVQTGVIGCAPLAAGIHSVSCPLTTSQIPGNRSSISNAAASKNASGAEFAAADAEVRAVDFQGLADRPRPRVGIDAGSDAARRPGPFLPKAL